MNEWGALHKLLILYFSLPPLDQNTAIVRNDNTINQRLNIGIQP